MTMESLSLDDRLIAKEHVGELLDALRDVADAYVAHQNAKQGRQKEACLTRLVLEGRAVLTLLNKYDLR